MVIAHGTTASRTVRVGLAGWSEAVSRYRDRFLAEGGTGLARYAGTFDFVEINSSFYRIPRAETCAKWASEVPPDFRFSVKMNRLITHYSRLRDPGLLGSFFSSVDGLGDKLAVVLVQLPPTLGYEAAVAGKFFHRLRDRCPVCIVCEPRHRSWTDDAARALLSSLRVGLVRTIIPETHDAADDNAGLPIYYRLHGAPRRYYSPYSAGQLSSLAAFLAQKEDVTRYVVFDNTASKAGVDNALELRRLLAAD
jgi:uncharacterized protein YecE (DUF72 family)